MIVTLLRALPVKVVSEMLSHSDISTPLRIHAHTEGAQEQAVSVMANRLDAEAKETMRATEGEEDA